MKVFLDMVGCRLNQGEIEKYARQFRAAGHTLVAYPGEADLVVLNTCAVTAAASSDSRQKVRQAVRAGAKEVVLTGCWSTLDPKQAAAMPGVSRVVNNDDKENLVLRVLEPDRCGEVKKMNRQPVPGARQRTRAFIKAQDGCDNYCTFCVTRLARGTSRSLQPETILADIEAALEGGSQEIILTGVNLGSWGRDLNPGRDLAWLVRKVLDETETRRMRFSSLEPWDLDRGFFDLWAKSRLCRHLHLPLQSGCDRTLRRMGRKITRAGFASIVEYAREAVEGIAITTDVMVGFPGETLQDFEESLEFVKTIGFAGGHVFSFSPRPGTPAAEMEGQVAKQEKRARSGRMRDALDKAGCEFRQKFLGDPLTALWETSRQVSPGRWINEGLTDNYLRVEAESGIGMWNQISRVRITGEGDEALLGQILTD